MKVKETKKLADFIKSLSPQFIEKIKDKLEFAYSPDSKNEFILKTEHYSQELGKRPFPAQQDIINTLVTGFLKLKKKALILVGEMGTGKTLMSILTIHSIGRHKKRPLRTLIICPPTLISTWTEEIKNLYQDKATIVNLNTPDALKILIKLKQKRKVKPQTPTFFISGWNRMKTSFKKMLDINLYRHKYLKNALCPHCGLDLDQHEMLIKGRNPYCPGCKTPLYVPDTSSKNHKKYAPVEFIKKYLKNYFDFLIADEVHQLKGEDTIQGAMLGQLSSCCKQTLCLTGTLSGGKASDVFYILQRTIALNYPKSERSRILPPYNAKTEFVSFYGTIEEVRKETYNYKTTGRNTFRSRTIKEKPGISPLIVKNFFLENAVFIRLSDIASSLPPFEEKIEFCNLPKDLLKRYEEFEDEVKEAVKKALKQGDMTVLGQMISSLLAWPDFPQYGCMVTNQNNEVVAYAPGLPVEKTPKDEKLIEIIKKAKQENRKVLVYVEYTQKWNGDQHIASILKKEGIKPLILKSSIPTHKRLDWIKSRIPDYDCLICQPRLVEVGMNLIEFPEIVFYQTGYSIYTLRQAGRRSFRPGQPQKVTVTYLINKNTFQEKAMTLIASKLEASLILEGELLDKGLVALSENHDNMLTELAKTLINQKNTKSLEEQFLKYKQKELESSIFIHSVSPNTCIKTTTTLEVNNQKNTITFSRPLFPSTSVRIYGKIIKIKPDLFKGKIGNLNVVIQNSQVKTIRGKVIGSLHKNVLKLDTPLKNVPTQKLLLKKQPSLLVEEYLLANLSSAE